MQTVPVELLSSTIVQQSALDAEAAARIAVAAAAAGVLVGTQFLTGAGTYTPTAGATRGLMFVQAAGASGTSNAGGTSTGAGGGGGETRIYTLTGITGTYAYSCGAGGVAIAGAAGAAGGDTTFGTGPLVTAKGGAAGTSITAGAGGTGGTGGTGISGSGGRAGSSTNSNIYPCIGGSPGLGLFGGLSGVNSSNAWPSANGFGTGGGGGVNNARAQDGSAGCILVIEFK